jgi:hypothetical protein
MHVLLVYDSPFITNFMQPETNGNAAADTPNHRARWHHLDSLSSKCSSLA